MTTTKEEQICDNSTDHIMRLVEERSSPITEKDKERLRQSVFNEVLNAMRRAVMMEEAKK